MNTHFTTRDVAEILGVDHWRVMRLYETGTLPNPPRIGRLRAIPRSELADIVEALRDRGWLAMQQKKSPGDTNAGANTSHNYPDGNRGGRS
jgi:predicted DNA-binding transcriptional regulator AlpA